jgi:endoglucanase
LDAPSDPGRAAREFATAREVYAAAKKRNVQAEDIVTALPHAFYPESSWRDDLELAAAELARAALALGDRSAGRWVGRADHWAHAYLRKEAGHDTLNLYDTSALAHADLVRAMRDLSATVGTASGIAEDALVGNLRARLHIARQRAAADPFRAGAVYSDFDAAPHTFGLVATARLYAVLTGDHRFDRFATSQRDWAMGANAWGVSLMVGVGTTFPHCMQHVVANLSGSTDGSRPLVRGAVVNGPNDEHLFTDGLGEFFDEGVTCPADGKDRFEQFTGHGSRFVDDVRSWQTVEPALDFTAVAMLAFALSSTQS